MLTNFKTTLTNKKQLTSNVYLFTFKLIDPPEINFIPGQYLILKINGKPRPYSIASSNLVKNQIDFIIEIILGGLGSTYLNNLKVNDEVVFQGPAGQFMFRENDKKKIFLVTGTGIVPVRSILSSLVISSEARNLDDEVVVNKDNYASLDSSSPPSVVPRNDRDGVYLFWGLKTYKDVYLLEELKQFNPKICLSREQNLDMIPESDRQYFDLGHIDVCFEKQFVNLTIEQLMNSEFYLCGGRDVVESLRQFLLSKNIPQENIVFEKF